MFKNREHKLLELLDEHAKGDINMPTELETIMLDDVMDYIKNKFDNKDGLKELNDLIKKTQNSKSGKNIL